MTANSGTFQIFLNKTIDPQLLVPNVYCRKRIALNGVYKLTVTKFVFSTNIGTDYTAINGSVALLIDSPQLTNQVVTDSPGPILLQSYVNAAYISSTAPYDTFMKNSYISNLQGQLLINIRTPNPNNFNQWGDYWDSYYSPGMVASLYNSALIEIMYEKIE
jgi:hypothetical protein